MSWLKRASQCACRLFPRRPPARQVQQPVPLAIMVTEARADFLCSYALQ